MAVRHLPAPDGRAAQGCNISCINQSPEKPGPARHFWVRRAESNFWFRCYRTPYAESAPLDLIDGKRLVKALNQSRKHVLLPQTYKAMCQQCGGIVQHRLDRDQDEARPCGNAHMGISALSGHRYPVDGQGIAR